jgi:hypothetical protein
MGQIFENVGNLHRYPGTDSGNDDTLIAGPCTFSPDGGEVSEVFLLVITAAGNVRVGIYADNGSGTPAALLGQSASTPAVAGWMTIGLLAPAVIPAGSSFWIATLCDDDGLVTSQEVDDNAGRGTELDQIVAQAFGALPNPFPAPTSTGSRARAIGCRVVPV